MRERVGAGSGPGVVLYTLLAVGLVAPSFITTALSPVLPMLAAYFGGGTAGEVLAERAQALPFLGLALGGLFAGPIIARLRLKNGLLIGAGAYAAAGLGAAIADMAALLLACLFLVGLSASMLNAGLAAATGRVFADGPARARLLGFQIALSDLAAITASLVAGVAAQYVGWRAPLAIYPLFGIFLLVLLAPTRLPDARRQDGAKGDLWAALTSAFSVYLAAASIMFLIGAQSSLLPFHLEAGGLTSSGSRALVLVATPIFAMVGSTSYALIRGRVSDRRLLWIAIVASVGGYCGIALWHGGVLPAALAAAATGIGIGFSMPLVIRAAFARVEPHLHGHSIGLVTTASYLGAFAGPMLLGPLMRLIGGQALFLLCAAAWLVIAPIVVIRLDGRRAAAPIPAATTNRIGHLGDLGEVRQ